MIGVRGCEGPASPLRPTCNRVAKSLASLQLQTWLQAGFSGFQERHIDLTKTATHDSIVR